MVEIDVTKVSSKGQVVIPRKFRDKFKEGDSIIVIESGKNLILKKETDADKQFQEDLEFARRTEEAWKQIDNGEYTSYNSLEEFLKTLKVKNA